MYINNRFTPFWLLLQNCENKAVKHILYYDVLLAVVYYCEECIITSPDIVCDDCG